MMSSSLWENLYVLKSDLNASKLYAVANKEKQENMSEYIEFVGNRRNTPTNEYSSSAAASKAVA